MDDFPLDRTELAGSLLSLEFSDGGRIQQLWAVDPSLQDANEEFQFCCPPIAMGEESTQDYLPGTILLGARTHPDDPWILSRNSEARPLDDDETDGALVGFAYEFAFLEDLEAIGKFREIPGVVPQIAWELTITNRSRRSVEIGELGFPLAFNNVYDGYPRTDEGARLLFQDRVYLHLNVGAAASHLFVQRLNGRPPGLVVVPGEDTRWEFACHVPASLNTDLRWEGIPVVYVHSRATIEREGWSEWVGGHTSLVLEPGESRVYHMRFMCADRYRGDGVHTALAAAGRPAFRLFPAAVAPAEVGIAVEIAGCTPATFEADVEAELETDSDEEGGFCFVKPAEPGPVRLRLEDTQGRESEAYLLLTEPLEKLIHARAAWICERQVVTEGSLKHAIAPSNLVEGGPVVDPESYLTPFGIESGLSEALFLAEKNVLYPDAAQIAILDRYLSDFFEAKVFNTGDGSIGALLPNPDAVAVGHGRASIYLLAVALYGAMARLSNGYGAIRDTRTYLDLAERAADGYRHGTDALGLGNLPLIEEVTELARETGRAGFLALLHQRKRQAFGNHSFWGAEGWTTSALAEPAVLWSHASDEGPGRSRRDSYLRSLRYLSAARSLSPSWWWYASDKRFGEEYDGIPHPAMADKGELGLGWSTVANSRRLLAAFEHDAPLDETRMRMAFGGMLGIWALVRPDGAAGMGYCPDPASKMYGVAWTSGDLGLGLFHYLRGAAAYVLPSRTQGVVTFGCSFEVEGQGSEEAFTIRPWDGVGRRVVVRHVGLDVRSERFRIEEVRFAATKKWATLKLRNASDKERSGEFKVRGLWGRSLRIDGVAVENRPDGLTYELTIPAGTTREIRIEHAS